MYIIEIILMKVLNTFKSFRINSDETIKSAPDMNLCKNMSSVSQRLLNPTEIIATAHL